uniref:SFRICE_029183 n=1 Tax=Spodoptera frugiperda TaxID=7108 RepID=A0A2H1VVW9_SPOFR
MLRHYYSAQEYTDMILMYCECHQNAALSLRTYLERYGASRHCPTVVRTIISAVQRLRDNQPLMPNTHDGVAGQQTSAILEQRVLTHFRNNPTCSLRQAGRTFHVHHRTIHQILKKNKVRPYKYCKVQALLPRDKPVREMGCRWVLDRIAQDQHFVRNVFWTDEKLCDGPISEYLDGLSVAANSRVWFQLDGAPPHSVLLARERQNIMFGDSLKMKFTRGYQKAKLSSEYGLSTLPIN